MSDIEEAIYSLSAVRLTGHAKYNRSKHQPRRKSVGHQLRRKFSRPSASEGFLYALRDHEVVDDWQERTSTLTCMQHGGIASKQAKARLRLASSLASRPRVGQAGRPQIQPSTSAGTCNREMGRYCANFHSASNNTFAAGVQRAQVSALSPLNSPRHRAPSCDGSLT